MNRHDLIEKIYADHAGKMTRAEVQGIVEMTFNTIVDQLADAGTVKIAHFGTFTSVSSPERNVRNPRTREPVRMPARQVPKFRASRALLSAMNPEESECAV
jgi:DNA-binding protein HU-beta